MEGVTDATAAACFRASLRSVDMSPQSQKNQRLSAELATQQKSTPKARPGTQDSAYDRDDEEAERIRETFRRTLVHRYQSLVGAWKEIDPQCHGRLSFFDFCRACRRLGCDSEARVLWEALDANGDGFITLDEVDPDLAILLEQFSQQLVQRCGSADHAWKEHFNKQGFGRCPAERFFRSCERLGFRGDVGSVYNALDVDGASTGIAFEDFQLLDKWFKTNSPEGRWNYGQLRAIILPK